MLSETFKFHASDILEICNFEKQTEESFNEIKTFPGHDYFRKAITILTTYSKIVSRSEITAKF